MYLLILINEIMYFIMSMLNCKRRFMKIHDIILSDIEKPTTLLKSVRRKPKGGKNPCSNIS